MMMKIIWLRHGTVDCNTLAADTLTPKGRELAKTLPVLLEKNDLHPEVVFYDASCKSGKTITRCEQTVEMLESVEKIPYNFDSVDPIFEKCKQVAEALICYTSESLKYFPRIENSICAAYMGDASLPKAPKDVTNKLYEDMIVSEYDGSVVRQIDTISTSDGK